MIYTVDDIARTNKPMRIFDAEDKEHFYVIECDTKTGHIVKFRLDENNKPVLNKTRDQILKIDIMAPAPLKVVEK